MTYMEEQIFTEEPLPIPVLEGEIKLFFGEVPNKPGIYRFLDKSDILFILEKRSPKKTQCLT